MRYKIIARTNGYIANRDVLFHGKSLVTLVDDLSLSDAHYALLQMFNGYRVRDGESPVFSWGAAQLCKSEPIAYPTDTNGCRRFDYDSRIFEIVLDEDD